MRGLIVIAFLLVISTANAQSWLDIERQWRDNEASKNLTAYIKISITDTRTYKENEMPLPILHDAIIAKFTDKGLNVIDDINDTLKNIRPLKININADYLNYMESSTDNLFLKGILSVTIDKGDFIATNADFKAAYDILIPHVNIKSIYKDKNSSLKRGQELALLSQLSGQVVDGIMDQLNHSASRIFEVVSFGKALIFKGNKEKAKNDAIADALLNASTKAFGKKIQSETTMVDMGNVSEVIKESVNGTVVEYAPVEKFNAISKDNYYCILVKSILKL